jgi:hypothetical protein
MVIYAKAPDVSLVEPNAPPWAQRFALRIGQYFQSKFPTQPTRFFYCDKVDLPPAADWPGCVVVVVDQECLAVARLGAWRRLNLGGPV